MVLISPCDSAASVVCASSLINVCQSYPATRFLPSLLAAANNCMLVVSVLPTTVEGEGTPISLAASWHMVNKLILYLLLIVV